MFDPPRDYVTHDVPTSELRRLFNDARFEERADSGELRRLVRKRTERLAPPEAGQPPGTVTHILRYFDEAGRVVAIAHEYLRPDGTIGGSGQRDPKWLRIGGDAYGIAPDAE